jgi:hypothetical protein
MNFGEGIITISGADDASWLELLPYGSAYHTVV